MRNWFPFTDYDFYGYLASGFVLLFAADYAFTGGSFMLRDEWSFVEIVLAVAVAYFVGQIVAAPSSVLLEHWLARRVLRPPVALMIASAPPRRIERFLARYVVGRYYEPLPEAIRQAVLDKAAKATNSAVADIEHDAEAVFGSAFSVARRSEDASRRMDDLRNQYGLNRNMAFTALVAWLLFLGKAVANGASDAYIVSALSILMAIGLFARFLKFYSSFGAEILRTFAFSDSGGGQQ